MIRSSHDLLVLSVKPLTCDVFLVDCTPSTPRHLWHTLQAAFLSQLCWILLCYSQTRRLLHLLSRDSTRTTMISARVLSVLSCSVDLLCFDPICSSQFILIVFVCWPHKKENIVMLTQKGNIVLPQQKMEHHQTSDN